MKLLIKRRGIGAGDWIMCASVIRHLNVALPDLEVMLDMTHCPVLASDFIRASNAAFIPVIGSVRADAVITHLGYPHLDQCHKHLIAHMLDQVSAAIHHKLAFSFAHLATIARPPQVRAPHVAMVSCGRVPIRRQNGQGSGYMSKHWGWENFLSVAAALTVPIVQIGRPSARVIPHATPRMGAGFSDLVSILDSAQQVICQVDGVAHLCGHLGVRCLVVYCGQERSQFTHYPHQEAMPNPRPQEVASRVKPDGDENRRPLATHAVGSWMRNQHQPL